jgi:hypothetical protein
MRTLATLVLLTLIGLGGQPSIGADCGGSTQTCKCDRCGCHAACVEKTCQVVCEVKKETKTCWCVECKDICPLMPGCRKECRCGCHEQNGCEEHCSKCKSNPPPRCGHPKCVKKLVKKEYQVEVPVYKCVVQHLCSQCCGGEATAVEAPKGAPKASPAPTPAPLPPPPQEKTRR